MAFYIQKRYFSPISRQLQHLSILVVKEGNENAEKIQALKNALFSEEVKTFITENYSGAVVPIF